MTKDEFYRLPVGTVIASPWTGWQFTVTKSDGKTLATVRNDGKEVSDMVFASSFEVVRMPQGEGS